MEQHYYILVLLFICHIIAISLSDTVIDKNNQNSGEINLKETYSDHRSKLPIFPKNTIKFVITSKPQINTVYSNKEKGLMTKVPIMPHLSLKTRTEVISTEQLTSRKPLMKLRKFTLKTLANGKYNWLEKNTPLDLKKEDTTLRSSILRTETVNQIPEDPITEPYVNEEIQSNIEKILLLPNDGKSKKAQIAEDVIDPITELYLPEESRSNIKKVSLIHFGEKSKMDQSSKEPVNNKMNVDDFLFDEIEDRNEFIFLETNEDETLVVNNILDNTGQDFEYSFETTTELKNNMMEKDTRFKRSKNIIVEENMASTISGLKYTGQETRLNNDLYFKNINS